MSEFLLAHEAQLRYYALLAAFGGVALIEALRPREPVARVGPRWAIAAVLTAAGAVLALAAVPLLAVELAVWCARQRIGLLNLLHAPAWLEAAAALVLLDLSRYVQHRLLHRVPWLWRLHQAHHSDTGYDVSTGLRFHPAEAVVTVAMQAATIVVLGASPMTVLAHEVVHAFASAWAHANIRVPPRIDAALRRVIVTPTLHAIHHSRAPEDAGRNFSALLCVWDRIFGSFAGVSARPLPLRYGLADREPPAGAELRWLLALPLARPAPRFGDRGSRVSSAS